MIANNLTISIPFNGCNKQCPYCISKMTGYINPEYSIEFKLSQMIKKITKVSQIALMSGVTSVLITSKGEPLLNMVAVKYFLEKFANFKTELQTNGELLTEEILDSLDENLDILSISIDNTADLNKFIPILEYIHNNNLSFIVRFTYNVINYNNFILFYDLVTFCKKYKVRQLTFRQVSIPEFGIMDTKEAKDAIHYIKEEIPRDNINNFFKFLNENILTLKLKSELVFESEVGKIYDYDGISIMTINNCIQNRANENMIRSLIFKEDGHLYTSWNSNASIIL